MKKFRNILTTTILSLIALSLYPQKMIVVKGVVEGVRFEKVSLITYADNFSQLKKELANVLTDENGKFLLTLQLPETTYAFLKVGLKKGELYLKPGATYKLKIFPDTVTAGSVFDKTPLHFELQADDGGLNEKIKQFNMLYNTFLMDNFRRIYLSRDKKAVDEFKVQIKEKFGDSAGAYFNIYVKYAVGQLIWLSKTKSLKVILKEYFIENPIAYNNIQYADFFKEFFKEYFNRYFYNKYFEQLQKAVYTANVQLLDSVLKTDELLTQNKQLYELALIQSSCKLFYDKNFSKKGALKLLKEIAKMSKFEINRSIAGNYVKKLQWLMPGTEAPEINLPLANGKLLKKEDLKGSFTVLDFMKADCNICLSHIDFLKDINSKLGSKIKIVLLVYGDNSEKINQLMKKEGLDWPMLYVGKRTDILENYGVAVFPSYVILNPDGTIAQAPAAMPDENMEQDLVRMIYHWKKKHHE